MKLLLSGLGAIGAGVGMPGYVESHLSIAQSFGIAIVGGVDPNPTRQAEFGDATGASTYFDLKSTTGSDPDIVVIASNQESHLDNLRFVTKHFPKASIICEKPFGRNEIESAAMFELVKASGSKCYVNYSRQFSKGYKTLKKNLKGELIGGNVTYSHGLARSCSHYIRLTIGLFGMPTKVKKQESLTSQNPSFELIYESGARINFIGVPDSSYRVAEFIFSTTMETLVVSEAMNWKLLMANTKETPEWPRDLETISTGDFSGGLTELYQNILDENASAKDIASELDCSPNLIISKIRSYV
jgi:predicted dehydrogenase